VSFRDIVELRRKYAGQAGQLVNDFYVPVLRQAVRYDRQAGYFDSSSLVQIAEGVAGFIQNVRALPEPSEETPMRVITGATWSEVDAEAYKKGRQALQETLESTLVRHFEPSDEECQLLGLPKGWRPEADQIAKHRLGALAWMVASGLVEVRVAFPLDPSGRPYYPGRGGALFHPKAGVLWDPDGNRVVFSGSINETGAAWHRNREKIEVKRSWFSEQDQEDIQDEIEEFNTIWEGDDPQLLVLPLPNAVREYLDRFVPPEGPPERDPLEIPATVDAVPEEDREAARRFLQAPQLPGGERLVLDPLWADGDPLKLFPHQERVVARATREFPQAFLYCDEVGLGKTIEAGVSLRNLLLKGSIHRVLIVAPRSLVRQWMEELREKLALTAWFYDGKVLRDVGGRVRVVNHPLDQDGIVIVSRHLIARADRRNEVLNVLAPWDLMIVDEAHAARRRVFGKDEPNQLLDLLQEMKSRQLYGSLWLLTATPMQLDPQEVHDLLGLCGLEDPPWGDWADVLGFQSFFNTLRSFPSRKDARPEVIRMTRVAVDQEAPDLSPSHVPGASGVWPQFRWQSFVQKVRSGAGLALALNDMTVTQADALVPHLARQTPLAVYMFRHTRATLRAYQERGLVHGLATRNPIDVPVEFQTSQERDLYHRIDELCSRFYKLAELPPDERSGIGFLMAVFRKRLASSFEAFRKSLERRRDAIEDVQRGIASLKAEAFQDDLLVEETELDEEATGSEALDRELARLLQLQQDPHRRAQLEAERVYLQEYIRDLEQMAVDRKFKVFERTLTELVEDGHRVIVFTQYLDTLDFIRSRLAHRFGDQIACYSGRGGEVWDSTQNNWREVEKAEIKARSKKSHPRAIRILLGTDAASEGLNLQQFSSLVNYDLPWNPMRVEQRIGRIDRIGQETPVVNIVNLYVKDTIEEDTYRTLKDRIGAFIDVVGPLQPILAEMPRILRRVARGELELEDARRLLDERSKAKPNVAIESLEGCVREDLVEDVASTTQASPVTQQDLAAWCLTHPAPGMRIVAVLEPGLQSVDPDGMQACHAVTWAYIPPQLGISPNEEIQVTFNGALADRHPPTGPRSDHTEASPGGHEGVRLLTWGDPYLQAWLESLSGGKN
jgi:superfamily II DNA or RNA helicase